MRYIFLFLVLLFVPFLSVASTDSPPPYYEQKTILLRDLKPQTARSHFFLRGNVFLTTGTPVSFAPDDAALDVTGFTPIGDVINGDYLTSENEVIVAPFALDSVSKRRGSPINFSGYVGYQYRSFMMEIGFTGMAPRNRDFDRQDTYNTVLNTGDVDIDLHEQGGNAVAVANQTDSYSLVLSQQTSLHFSPAVEVNFYGIRQRYRIARRFYDVYFSVGAKFSFATLTADAMTLTISDSMLGSIKGKESLNGKDAYYEGEYTATYVLSEGIRKTSFMIMPSIAAGYGYAISPHTYMDFMFRLYYRPSLSARSDSSFAKGEELSPTSWSFTGSKTSGDPVYDNGLGFGNVGSGTPVPTVVMPAGFSTDASIQRGAEAQFIISLRYYFHR